MKKTIVFLNILMIVILQFNCEAKTISVCQTCNQRSISEAIRMASAHDRIEVSSGIYFENEILIDKSIFIHGLGHPVINGGNKSNVFIIKTANVTIDGFELINSGRSSMKDYAGIRAENSNNVTIKNCILKDNYFGVYLLNCNDCLVKGNQVVGNAISESTSGNGIHLWKSKNIVVAGNVTTSNRDGIYLEFAENCSISNNLSRLNLRYGLHFMFSNGNKYVGNRFSNNGCGVAVMYTHDVEMRDNIFEDNWGTASYGILLKDITNSKIYDNKFLRNTVGIYMEGVNNVEVSKNDFEANGWGLKLLGNCLNDTVSKNNFVNNTFDVVTNSFSTENSNLFEYNYWDRYDGYDLNKDKIGDIPFRPVSLFSVYVEKIPNSIVLLRTFLIGLLDSIERALPAIIPENLIDEKPLMKRSV